MATVARIVTIYCAIAGNYRRGPGRPPALIILGELGPDRLTRLLFDLVLGKKLIYIAAEYEISEKTLRRVFGLRRRPKDRSH